MQVCREMPLSWASGCSSASLLNASSLPQQSFSSSWNPGEGSIFSPTQRKQLFPWNESLCSLMWSIAFLTKTLYEPQRPELEVPTVKTSVPADFLERESPCEAVTNLQEWWRMKVKRARPSISLTQVSQQEPATALQSFLALRKESEAGHWSQK